MLLLLFLVKQEARLSAEGNVEKRGIENLRREYTVAVYMIKIVYGLEIYSINGRIA